MSEHSGAVSPWIVRVPTAGDAHAVADLVAAYDAAAFGTADYSVDDLRAEWADPGFILERDALVVSTAAGQLIGYVALTHRAQRVRYVADGYVHPGYRGRGIGTMLVRWAEAHACERLASAPAGVQVTLDQGTAGSDAAAAALFMHAGYTPVRSFWTMAVRLEEPPPMPVWPPGMSVRGFVPREDDAVVYAATQEAFRDHWGHASVPFKDWRAAHLERAGFDPSLVVVAREGAAVAGVIWTSTRAAGGWVDTLAVRRPWRGQSLGLALLRQAFDAFYQRGMREVRLGVDAASSTGATRLYQRAGMHIERRFDVYRKTLRDGREPE